MRRFGWLGAFAISSTLGCSSVPEPGNAAGREDATGADESSAGDRDTGIDPSATSGTLPTSTTATTTAEADSTSDSETGETSETGTDSTGEPSGPVPCQPQEGPVVVRTQTFGDPGAYVDDADDIAVEPAGGGTVSFIMMPDGGGDPIECDVWAQDCPDGEKCNPWANDGGSSWNALRCVDVADNPGQPGDSCTVEGSGVSGLDDCDVGAMCFGVDNETNIGECIEMCSGSPEAPTCDTDNTTCTISNNGVLVLCRPFCNPLANECAPGQACYPLGDAMVCSPDASGDSGAPGDPCEFINSCDPGTYCAAAEVVPGCSGSFCCSPYCTLGDDSSCLPGQSCAPLYPDGPPAECLEGVGGCAT